MGDVQTDVPKPNNPEPNIPPKPDKPKPKDDKPSKVLADVNISEVRGNTANYNSIAEFSVSLKSKPTSNVVIPVKSSNEKEGIATINQLVFTPDDWDQPHIVAVKGRNPNVKDGKQDYKIILGKAQSADKKYNGLDPADVAMKGIFLVLSKPTDSLKFIAGLDTRINVGTRYTGNDLLSYTLINKPEGMTIDKETGLISWNPAQSVEGNSYPVKVKVTDGFLVSEVDFSVVVPSSILLKQNVKNNKLTITESSNLLNGLVIEKKSGSDFKEINIRTVNKHDVSVVPKEFNKLTDIFLVTPKINGEVIVKFPQSLLPNNVSVFDLKLFHYTSSLKEKGKNYGDKWISVGTDFNLEGDKNNPIVVLKLKSMEGLYFIGHQKLRGEPVSSLKLGAKYNTKGKVNTSNITCLPLLTSNGQTTYTRQDCEVSGTNKKFSVEGFANEDNTGSGTHWGGVTIETFVSWLLETQEKFDKLNLNYKPSFNVIVEPMSGYGKYDGEKLRISSSHDKEDQELTTAHEYFHHAEIETLLNGVNDENQKTQRINRYWQSGGDWIWEGMAYWFEDYFDDNSNRYPSDGVANNPSPLLLEKGINKPSNSYDTFLLWKLIDAVCDDNSKISLPDIFLGSMDNSWGADTLSNALSNSTCNFGHHLGTNKRSSLESALAYYQYATLYQKKISKLDKNENDQDGKFKFQPTTHFFEKGDWFDVGEIKGINVKDITSIPAYGAYSIEVKGSLWDDIESGKEAVLKVTTTDDNNKPLTVSILSDDNRFKGMNTLDGIQHLYYKTNNKKEHVFSQNELFPMLITLVNPNDKNVTIKDISFEIRDKTKPVNHPPTIDNFQINGEKGRARGNITISDQDNDNIRARLFLRTNKDNHDGECHMDITKDFGSNNFVPASEVNNLDFVTKDGANAGSCGNQDLAEGTYYVRIEVEDKSGSKINVEKGSVKIHGNTQKPVDPQPVDPQPVDPQPVDPQPVDPQPVDPQSTTIEPKVEMVRVSPIQGYTRDTNFTFKCKISNFATDYESNFDKYKKFSIDKGYSIKARFDNLAPTDGGGKIKVKVNADGTCGFDIKPKHSGDRTVQFYVMKDGQKVAGSESGKIDVTVFPTIYSKDTDLDDSIKYIDPKQQKVTVTSNGGNNFTFECKLPQGSMPSGYGIFASFDNQRGGWLTSKKGAGHEPVRINGDGTCSYTKSEPLQSAGNRKIRFGIFKTDEATADNEQRESVLGKYTESDTFEVTEANNISMKVDEFVNAQLGEAVDVDGYPDYNKYQCVDLMHLYIGDVLGVPRDDHNIRGNAYAIYQSIGTSKTIRSGSRTVRLDKIVNDTNDPNLIPQKGDIVFWNNGKYGHVAIFLSGDGYSFTSLDQNWPEDSKVHKQSHNYTNPAVVGWLRPTIVSE